MERRASRASSPVIKIELSESVKQSAIVERALYDGVQEFQRARGLFPETKHLLHAFAEEAGEVTKAYLDHHYKPGKPDERRKELIQTIAMALRLLVDGDPDFAPVPAP